MRRSQTYKTSRADLPQGKRVFIKDIAHYLLPPHQKSASIAPSLGDTTTSKSNGTYTNGITNGTTNGTTPSNASSNPTVVPTPLLNTFHFAFLIRHPRRAIPSYYRCTIPPLSHKTGFHSFMPSEAGYDELRRLFDYLRAQGIIGSDQVRITVVDADDLLDKPAAVIQKVCEDVGITYDEGMLAWGDDEEGQGRAVEKFEKWNGFHDDAIGSTGLRPRVNGAVSTYFLSIKGYLCEIGD